MIEIARRACDKAGGADALAKALGITSQAFYSWKEVPPRRVLDIERITGIPRHEIRPDLYPADDTGQTA